MYAVRHAGAGRLAPIAKCVLLEAFWTWDSLTAEWPEGGLETMMKWSEPCCPDVKTGKVVQRKRSDDGVTMICSTGQ